MVTATRKRSATIHPLGQRKAIEAVRSYQATALVLQGGGALGAYQAGVYQALAEAGIHPNWVAGISIGALNAAIIAGNPPERRIERLHEFWESICRSPLWPAAPAQDTPHWSTAMLDAMSGLAAWRALTEGQAGFFSPRWPSPLLPFGGASRASFYDLSPLRGTLERLVDFDRINDAGEMRVSVGAVNVRDGNFAYFDNTQQRLRPEHFMASAALPPGFAAVEIDGEFYWDGGMVSNTPLYRVLTEQPQRDTLIFQIDLWSARGALPGDLAQVAERAKDIQYSSRTRLITEYMRERQEQQRLLHELLALVPPEHQHEAAYQRAQTQASGALVNVIHLIYQDKPYRGHYKDFEFSERSMREHWHGGQADMRHTLAHPQWLKRPSAEHPFVTHDVHRSSSEKKNA
ncbi:MAG: patatin-like phospholipase family protein [Dyella sp.]